MRRNLFYLAILAFVIASCGNKAQVDNKPVIETATDVSRSDAPAASIVNVYYFHGQQRCKTCLVIEEVTKKVIVDNYKENPNVKFVDINFDEDKNNAVVERYEIAFSSLLIVKGEDFTDLTKQAFANAVNSPHLLANLIKEEVNKRVD